MTNNNNKFWLGKRGENTAHWKGGKPKCSLCNIVEIDYSRKGGLCRNCYRITAKDNAPNKGRVFSVEFRKKMSESKKGTLLGEKNPAKRLEVRIKISKALRGRVVNWTKNVPHYNSRGEKNHNWKGGIGRWRKKTIELKIWRES